MKWKPTISNIAERCFGDNCTVLKNESAYSPEPSGTTQCNHMTFMGQKRRFLIVSFLCTQTLWPIGGCGCWLHFKDSIHWLLGFGSTGALLLDRWAERLHFSRSRRPSGCECNTVFHTASIFFLYPPLQSQQQLGSLLSWLASSFLSRRVWLDADLLSHQKIPKTQKWMNENKPKSPL